VFERQLTITHAFCAHHHARLLRSHPAPCTLHPANPANIGHRQLTLPLLPGATEQDASSLLTRKDDAGSRVVTASSSNRIIIGA